MKSIEIVSLKIEKVGELKEFDSKISSPKDCGKILISLIGNSDRENFVVITLSTKNYINSIKNISIVSIGTLNSTLVHPREVFKIAIITNSASIIVGHNHPSSDCTPSNPDIEMTERLKECGKILGIEVLDHLIVSAEHFLSFKEKGLL